MADTRVLSCVPESSDMKICILCGKLTEGSVGRAGLQWKNICQTCKDEEDEALASQVKSQRETFEELMRALKMA